MKRYILWILYAACASALAEGFKPQQLYIDKWPSSISIYTRTFDDDGNPDGYMTGPDRLYSRKWEAGGPIIEREKITIRFWENETYVHAYKWNTEGWLEGPTPLIAAMRCYVTSKLGDNVDIPEELTQ